MRAPLVLLLIASHAFASHAFASPTDGIRTRAEPDDPLARVARDPGRFLHLDSGLRLTVDNLDSKIESVDSQFQLQGRAPMMLQTSWRENDRNVAVRGWRIARSRSYEKYGVSIAKTVGIEHLDSALGRHYLTIAATEIGKAFQLSRSARAWIGFAYANHRWFGKPPSGESDSKQLMMSAKLSY